jgi:hypothetical protein
MDVSFRIFSVMTFSTWQDWMFLGRYMWILRDGDSDGGVGSEGLCMGDSTEIGWIQF